MTVQVFLSEARSAGSCMACDRPSEKMALIRLTLESSQSSQIVRLCKECVAELLAGIILIRYGEH